MASHHWLTPSRLLIFILAFSIISFILFSLSDDCTCATIDTLVRKVRQLQEEIRTKDDILSSQKSSSSRRDKMEAREKEEQGWDPHILCILIPFRNRFEELMEFIPFMDKFLSHQSVKHKFYVINQIDTHRFNRASLLNAGFKELSEDCSYIALHDVDLLPRNPAISYHYDNVRNGPHHVSSPELHPKYDYSKFIGGIMLMTCEQFQKLNGLSNRFWGWGREDDELYMRIQEANMKISKPEGISTGRKTFYHIHDKKKRKRDVKRLGNQHKESFKRDPETGLDNVQYSVRSTQELSVNGAEGILLHVMIECDVTITPWCDDA
ncbi:beta-1,4-galactosyltransferase 7-like [Asterias amurensis]|uniref:beta-1,4-galactosyltransferase 7-like n=1 Tax=Asterias amurensis TaxID=7602 RepID=UPI003AB19DDD